MTRIGWLLFIYWLAGSLFFGVALGTKLSRCPHDPLPGAWDVVGVTIGWTPFAVAAIVSGRDAFVHQACRRPPA